MNIVEFQQRMLEEISYTDKQKEHIIMVSVKNGTPEAKSMIVMEECAELQEALYDIFGHRDPDNEYAHLLEELADVSIGLEYLRLIYEVPDYTGRPYPNQKNYNRTFRAGDALFIMKELSMLQQAISKSIRKHDDCLYDLHRRMKHVHARIHMIQKYYHISDKKLQQAVNVKLRREVVRNNIIFKEDEI